MHASLAHQTVLRREAVHALKVQPNGIYVDGTFGRGGHSAGILESLGVNGHLLGLDCDPQAEQYARTCFQTDNRFFFEKSNFGQLAEVVATHGLTGCVQGILLDIGVSSPQLDEPRRGFSFTQDGPLDMRMDPTSGVSASEWLATASEAEISHVIKAFGEERFHRRIARAIVETRRSIPIDTTLCLANIISASVPTREREKHPATRSFQAIRIFINRELEELQSALHQALQVLAPQGRLVVISFHSLEDRIVKRFVREQARGPELPLDLPVPTAPNGATLRVVGKALRPSAGEVASNPRSRSAIMRVAERLP